ncbi:Lipase, class 3 [Penicillium occitanis (nom. inval.)]|nr:Lipase, class 3 [Penicillium occitanis (nom. inval.)]PCH07464.1 hypothetical protein PENOC_019140 [Penicillium occitanis (nom. inval.)]
MKLQTGLVAGAMLTGPVAAAPKPIHRRTIPPSLLDNLDLFAQYSAAAYCSANLETTGTALACNVGNCPAGADESSSSSFGDATGYVAVDESNEYIILSFRGSSNLENWIANLDIPLIDVSSICSGCTVHEGFWDTWETVASDVTSQIESALSTYPNYTLVATGHSLGGALAAIAATVFRASGYTVQLYNYGQPRIGNLALADFITSETSGTNYRVTHSDDIVPKLPPELLGYHHFSPEYWITSNDNVTLTDSDVVEIQGVDSTAGNDGTSGDSIDAHSWYFVSISECS